MRILTVAATALAVQIQDTPESLDLIGLPTDDALEPMTNDDDLLAEEEDVLGQVSDEILPPTDEEVQNDMEQIPHDIQPPTDEEMAQAEKDLPDADQFLAELKSDYDEIQQIMTQIQAKWLK